jgi:hypothetical protein
MAEFDKLEKDIAREERVAQLEKDAEERRAKQRPTGEDGEARGQDGGEQRTVEQRQAEYRDAFEAFMRSGCDPALEPSSARSCAAGFVAEKRTRPPARPRPAATPCRRSSPTRSSGHEGLRSDVRPGRHARDRHQLGQRVRHPDQRRHGQFGRGARRRVRTSSTTTAATWSSARRASTPMSTRRRS